MAACLIITAGGKGTRFGSDLPKQFHVLLGVPIILRTINAFKNINTIKSIIITAPVEYQEHTRSILMKYMRNFPVEIIEGGKERQDSVYNALQTKTAKESDIVLIHDAVRPFVSEVLIRKLIAAASEVGGAIPALGINDTIREIRPDGTFQTIDRTYCRAVQTPQVFRTDLIFNAYTSARENDYYSTDDAAIFEYSDYDYIILNGEERNLKITTEKDMDLAEYYLSNK